MPFDGVPARRGRGGLFIPRVAFALTGRGASRRPVAVAATATWPAPTVEHTTNDRRYPTVSYATLPIWPAGANTDASIAAMTRLRTALQLPRARRRQCPMPAQL